MLAPVYISRYFQSDRCNYMRFRNWLYTQVGLHVRSDTISINQKLMHAVNPVLAFLWFQILDKSCSCIKLWEWIKISKGGGGTNNLLKKIIFVKSQM